MNDAIRKLLESAGYALTAVGCIGLASTALAQAPAQIPNAVKREATPARKPLALRQLEASVEVAWLGNPLTFPCPLEAIAGGSSITVRGAVPVEEIREKALEIARQVSGLEVIDQLSVRSDIPVYLPTRQSLPTLHRDAVSALVKALPRHANGFWLQTTATGRVIIKGAVPSPEERAEVSRCLRKVDGCSCVINQVRVLGTEADDKMVVAREKEMKPAPAAAKQAKPARIEHAVKAATPSVSLEPVLVEAPRRPAPAIPPAVLPVTKRPQQPTASLAFQAVPPASDAYISNGMIFVQEASKPAPQSTLQQVKAKDSGDAYVTSGTILADVPAMQAVALGADVLKNLKSQIARICGKQASEIEILASSGNELLIRVRARSIEEGEQLSFKILDMPELSAYSVALDISIPL